MTEEEEERLEMDRAIMLIIEDATSVVATLKGKRIELGPDIIADIVRIMRAGLEKP